MTTKIAFSYSHKDESLRDELEKHLRSLQRQGLIDTWHDRRILAGQDFSREIDKNFEQADVVLLLISSDFIASNYCYEIEMQAAIARHETGSTKVIPVVLRPCHWHDLPFGRLQAATKDGKPISDFPSLDHGFYQVVEAIKNALPSQPARSDTRTGDPNYSEKSARKGATPMPRVRSGSERSSNLAVKKHFSDKDRDDAIVECFTFISKYLKNSLEELSERNPDANPSVSVEQAERFEAALYIRGDHQSDCSVWIERDHRTNCIKYSASRGSKNSFNEMFSVADDGHIIGFTSLGLNHRSEDRNELLSETGVAEAIWSMFIEPLQ